MRVSGWVGSGNPDVMANRRVQGGGDPAQGPPRDVLRSIPTDTDVESFPDVPPANRPGGDGQRGGHDVDLDAFADRLGLGRDDTDEAEGPSTTDAGRSARSAPDTVTAALTRSATGAAGRALGAASGLLHGVARLMGSTSHRLDLIADRIDRR